jgi:hypothetical protein
MHPAPPQRYPKAPPSIHRHRRHIALALHRVLQLVKTVVYMDALVVSRVVFVAATSVVFMVEAFADGVEALQEWKTSSLFYFQIF